MNYAFLRTITLAVAAASFLTLLVSVSSFAATPISMTTASPGTGRLTRERAAIQSTYDQINAAFGDNHVERIREMLAPDYTQTDPKGHVLNRAESCKKLQTERDSIKTISTQFQITSIASDPHGILVEMRLHCAGTGQKKVLFFKVNGTFTNEMVVRDLWIQTADGWRIQNRVTLVDESHTQAS